MTSDVFCALETALLDITSLCSLMEELYVVCGACTCVHFTFVISLKITDLKSIFLYVVIKV